MMENKTLDILTFVKEYNDVKKKIVCEEFLNKNLVINDYVPFLKKVEMANKIARNSLLDKKNNTIYRQLSVQYILFIRSIITLYTNLVGSTEIWIDEYDALDSSGLLDVVISKIPEKEFSEFKTIVDQVENDYIYNYSRESTMSRFLNNLFETIKPNITSLFKIIDKRVKESSDEDLKVLFTNISNQIKHDN